MLKNWIYTFPENKQPPMREYVRSCFKIESLSSVQASKVTRACLTRTSVTWDVRLSKQKRSHPFPVLLTSWFEKMDIPPEMPFLCSEEPCYPYSSTLPVSSASSVTGNEGTMLSHHPPISLPPLVMEPSEHHPWPSNASVLPPVPTVTNNPNQVFPPPPPPPSQPEGNNTVNVPSEHSRPKVAKSKTSSDRSFKLHFFLTFLTLLQSCVIGFVAITQDKVDKWGGWPVTVGLGK